jgi:hypothetical protein
VLPKLLVILALLPLLAACNPFARPGQAPAGGSQVDIPASTGGTASAPVPFQSPFVLKKDGRTIQLQVREVNRSADAQVAAASPDNPAPPAGNSYILVYMQMDYLDGSHDTLFMSTDGGLKFTAGGREFASPDGSVPPQKWFAGTNMYPPTTIEGWLPPKYLPTELLEDAMLIYEGIYFQLH